MPKIAHITMGCAPIIPKRIQTPLSSKRTLRNNIKDISQEDIHDIIEDIALKAFELTFIKLGYKPKSMDDIIKLLTCISQVYTELYGWTSNKILIDIYMLFQTIDNSSEKRTNLYIQNQMNELLQVFSTVLKQYYGVQEEDIHEMLAKNFAVSRNISIIVQQCLGVTCDNNIAAADIVSCLQITKYLIFKIIDQQFIEIQINRFFQDIFDKFGISSEYKPVACYYTKISSINIQNPLVQYMQQINQNYQILYNMLSQSDKLVLIRLMQLNIDSNWSIYDSIINGNNRFFLIKLYNFYNI